MEKNVLIVGAPRSGTTYIGKVLEKTDSYTYFHEPFRINHGIVGINHWFPFSGSFEYSKLVDEFFNGHSKFVVKRHKKNKMWEYYLKKFIGNRDQIKYKKHFIEQKWSKSLLLKDPTASFLSDYIFTKGYAKVVIAIRHPMAFYYSVKQKNSEFDFKSLFDQKELIEFYLKDEAPLIKDSDRLTYEERTALLWKCIYKALIGMSTKHQDNNGWIVIKHEDICTSPVDSFQGLCEKLEINFRNETEHFIGETSNNKGKVLAKENMLHDFKRDSNALKNYWKQMVTDVQIKNIHNITSDISALYYDEDSWA